MKIEFKAMLDIVNRYCNQRYKCSNMPEGLKCIVHEMCKYVESPQFNVASFSNEGYQESYTDIQNDLFKRFGGFLAPYKRIKTL